MNSSFWGSGEVEEGHMQGLGKKAERRLACMSRKTQVSDGEEKRWDSWPQELYRTATNLRARRVEISVS